MLKSVRESMKLNRFHPYGNRALFRSRPGKHDKIDDDVHVTNTNTNATTNTNSKDAKNGNGNCIEGGELLDSVTGWKEKHASTSEAIVKAERHGSDISTEELQRRTVEHFVKKTKKGG